jgi:hypothetical protein
MIRGDSNRGGQGGPPEEGVARDCIRLSVHPEDVVGVHPPQRDHHAGDASAELGSRYHRQGSSATVGRPPCPLAQLPAWPWMAARVCAARLPSDSPAAPGLAGPAAAQAICIDHGLRLPPDP